MRTLLSANGIEKAYGRQIVLDRLDFTVAEKSRIALIGRNGSGKTTLMRIMAGLDESEGGSLQLMPYTRLGVLDQHETLPQTGTGLSFLIEKSSRPEWECLKLASRFALAADQLALAPSALSGGYQMRLKIVKMLLADPNLLLLDEPVNYLDLPTLLLFEAFLKNYAGAMVVTSHDREILDNLCTTTWEISRGQLTVFPGEVETYLDWKDEQAEFAKRTNKKLRREMAAAQEFVDRFRYKATKASAAQSKIKHIAKLRTKLKSLERGLPTAAFRIACAPVPAGTAVVCDDLAIGYGDVAVATGIAIEIPRGSKTAIVGENGRGKSTLLRTLAGTLAPLSGKMKWWHKADIGYYSQLSEETLPPSLTVLQALTQAAPADASGERILAAAGTFLFREDDLEKTCGVLSGGERARVRLARLVLAEHNVLLLDEPTNHLDAETVEVLAQALKDYTGTVVVVSHARTFMNALADKIFEVRNGTVRHYVGTYEEYVADLTSLAEATDLPEDATAAGPNGAERREKAMLLRERRRLQQKLEVKLEKCDKERGAILAYYFENPTDYVPEKSSRLVELDEEIAGLEKDWMKLEEQIQAVGN